jgi:MATE family multidrug resistance protein
MSEGHRADGVHDKSLCLAAALPSGRSLIFEMRCSRMQKTPLGVSSHPARFARGHAPTTEKPFPFSSRSAIAARVSHATFTARSVLAMLAPVARISFPLALFQLGGVVMNLTDTAMVGRLGAASLSAVAVGNGIYFTIFAVGMGAVMGADPLVAQAVGAGDFSLARATRDAARRVALKASLPIVVVLALAMFALPFASLARDVVEITWAYVVGRALGIPLELLYTAERAYLQGHGRTRAITIAVVTASLLNVPLDALFIFGGDAFVVIGLPAFPFPALGAFGAGIATSFCLLVQLLIVTRAAKALARESDDGGLVVESQKLVRIGVPIGLQYALEIGIFTLVSILMGAIGTLALAAHQIAITLSSASFRVALGVSTGASVVVGQRIGARDHGGALAAGTAGFIIGTAVMATAGCFFIFIPAVLARAFTDDETIIARAVPLLFISAAFQLSDGIQAVAGGVLRGAGDTRFTFISNAVAYWLIALPCSLVLGFVVDLGPEGLWWGLTIGLTVAAVAQAVRFYMRASRGYESL